MKICEKLSDTTMYPNQKIAYKKEGKYVKFYSLYGNIIAIMNTSTNINRIFDANLFPVDEDMIEINHIDFITPKQYFKIITLPTGDIGSASGKIYTDIEYNELGLIKSIKKNSPEGERKYFYQYNKYGQLLKITEDKFINKILLENKYDEKGRLISQERNYEDPKLKREYFYNDKYQIIKENIKENNTDYTLIYEYNTSGQLIKKHSEDKNRIFEYTYDEKGLLIKELTYMATINKNNSKEIQNNFLENSFEYDEKGNLLKETTKEVLYHNTTVLVNHKWIDINTEEQKKKSWEEYKKGEEYFFRTITITNYQYSENNIIAADKKVYKNYSDGNNYHSDKVSSETTQYTYNNWGQIIKREIFKDNKTEEPEVTEFSY